MLLAILQKRLCAQIAKGYPRLEHLVQFHERVQSLLDQFGQEVAELINIYRMETPLAGIVALLGQFKIPDDEIRILAEDLLDQLPS